MPKVAVLYEIAEDIYRLLKREAEDHEIKISKNKTVKLVDEDGNKAKPIMFETRNLIGRIFGTNALGPISLMSYIPKYKASYKHSHTVDFGGVTKGKMDMATYKLMSEEDSLKELLASDRPKFEMFMYFIFGAIAGAFAVYVLLTGDFTAITG